MKCFPKLSDLSSYYPLLNAFQNIQVHGQYAAAIVPNLASMDVKNVLINS